MSRLLVTIIFTLLFYAVMVFIADWWIILEWRVMVSCVIGIGIVNVINNGINETIKDRN